MLAPQLLTLFNKAIPSTGETHLNTAVQSLSEHCQLLSNRYQPIQVFRYDHKLKRLYIQAGVTDEIALIIKEDGIWDFVL